MNTYMIEHNFHSPTGQAVHVWVIYHMDQVFSFSFAASPTWILENVDLYAAKKVA